MKPCPNCNQEMRGGTVFCPHCGFRMTTPSTEGKLLTGSHLGDVILGIVLHSLLLIGLNALVGAASHKLFAFCILYTPVFSGILYAVIAGKFRYKSLGAGVWWTYLVSILAILATFIVLFGVCLVGGFAASRH